MFVPHLLDAKHLPNYRFAGARCDSFSTSPKGGGANGFVSLDMVPVVRLHHSRERGNRVFLLDLLDGAVFDGAQSVA